MSKNNEKIKFKTCPLCGEKFIPNEESHIVPKFVFKRIMNNSPSRFMRNPNEPNVRLQDGTKMYLLCGKCEDRFSKLETKFANKVFHPYKNGKLKDFEYDEWLMKFIVSVNWRTLYLDLVEHVKNQDLKIEELEIIIESERILREFLLEERNDIGEVEVNMFLFNDIKEADEDIKNSNPTSFILNSSFDYTNICYYEKEIGISVIANLSGILIFTVIKKLSIEEGKNMKVKLNGGTFKIDNQQCRYDVVIDAFNLIKELDEKKKEISKSEMEKIIKSVEKNKERLEKSEIFQHMKKDFELQDK